jgi:hypothetical protein
MAAKQEHASVMASSAVDKNRPVTELGPLPGAVSDETRLDPGDPIAMSAVTCRDGRTHARLEHGLIRGLAAMRRVAAALSFDELQAQVAGAAVSSPFGVATEDARTRGYASTRPSV